MDKVGLRAVIMHLHIKGLSPKEIYEDMLATLKIMLHHTPWSKNGKQNLKGGERA